MVYIYKKIIGKKYHYYLRISKRIKDRVIAKDIAYLGSEIKEVRKKLEHLQNYKKEIRKSYKVIEKFINAEYYLNKIKQKKLKKNDYFFYDDLLKIESARLHYTSKFLKKNEKTKSDIYDEFIINFVYNSNSIEGNTITLGETAKLLRENITPKNKTLREVNDMKNSQRVFNFLLKSKKKIDEKLIIYIHDELLKNIDNRKGYRTDEVKIIGAGFKPTPPIYIKTDIKILLDLYNKNKDLHPLILASIFHHKLEKIHPFFDGNGRTGRMMMNYILLKNKYPPIIIRKKTRSDYLEALKSADKNLLTKILPDDYKNLLKYILNEFIANYWNDFL